MRIVLLAILLLPMTVGAAGLSPVQKHGDLQVNGAQIHDARGEVFVVAGPSLFWGNRDWGSRASYDPDAYYNREVVAWFHENWKAPIIRIAMGAESRGGYLEDPEGRWEKISAVAEASIDLGLYFIVDWHSHHAEDNPEAAVAFFERVADSWGHTPNLIYEIYNEPLNTADWSTVVKPYSELVIAAIRAKDPDNLILVGTQTWSQDVDKAADDPIEGVPNLAYTLHFYAGTHGDTLRAKARYAMDKGLPLFVSEYGTVNANGDGGADHESTREWMDFLREHQLSHLNWSVHSKEEGASILLPGSPPTAQWTDANISDSGKLAQRYALEWNTPAESSADN